MSDVLRPSAAAAEAEWARRVRANREQVDRFREAEDGKDFYGSIASMFAADPRRTDEPMLELLRAEVRSGESWLDIGAGGGRYALPLALLAGEVIALDPSEGMLGVLRQGMAEHGIANVRIVQDRWPSAQPPRAEVAFISHVGYDIEEIGAFLGGMERAAPRCVAILFDRRPTAPYDALWPEVHGEARETLPALRELLVLLIARGHLPSLRLAERATMSYESFDQALHFARRQTWVRPDGEKDRRLQALLRERLIERDGRWAFDWGPSLVGLVAWSSRPGD